MTKSAITDSPSLTIIGAGCAGLSLAKAIGADKLASPTLYTDKPATERPAHIWGFWHMPWLNEAADLASARYENWHIITEDMTIAHHSKNHPYHMLSSKKWLAHCLATSRCDETITKVTDLPETPFFDSRPIAPPQDALYQHFLGQHIHAEDDIFDAATAILMDFRCDQSQGLHFIYLLPTAPNKALIESTLFTQTPLDEAYYKDAINAYMARHYKGAAYQVVGQEKGIIPLADCRDTTNKEHAIGARGGALRPSSGYAFSFIQKQIAEIISHFKKTGQWQATSPISHRDYWMDKVFLHVLQTRPSIAISLFAKMAKALNGTEFALFMSGMASWRIIFKVVFAMPKRPFLSAAMAVFFKKGARS